MKKLKFQNSLEEYTISKSRSSITNQNNTIFSVVVIGRSCAGMLFVTLHHHCEQQVCSPLCVMYLDVGGSAEDMLHDLDVIKAAEELGLFLNNNKSVMMHQ